MVRVLEQKRLLKLVPATVSEFDLSSVDYIVAVVEHNDASQKLRDALLGRFNAAEGEEGRLSPPEGLNIRIGFLKKGDLLLRYDTGFV